MAHTRKPSSNETSATYRKPPRDLRMLLVQAMAYYPNQNIPEATAVVYLKEWERIAERHGDRFEAATWNVIRRSDFFPLPNAISAECESMKREKFFSGPSIHIWECRLCFTRQASVDAQDCHKCHGHRFEQERLTPEKETSVDMKRYHESIRTNPERFVKIGDLFREAAANVLRRRRG